MGGSFNLVFLNDGRGRFAQDFNSNLVSTGDKFASPGDINGDGLLDYVISGDSRTEVWLAKRSPTIAKSSVASAAITAAIFADADGASSSKVKGIDSSFGDLDGDNDLDLVLVRYVNTASASGSTAADPQWRAIIMRNTNGDGSFEPMASVLDGVIAVRSVADFNGDAANDLLVIRTTTGSNAVEVAIYLNTGSGVMDSGSVVPGAYAHSNCSRLLVADTAVVPAGASSCTQKCLTAGDLDGDLDIDFIDCHGYVHLNSGDGKAFTTTRIPTTSSHTALSARLGDVDGDNDLDYIFTSTTSYSGGVTVYDVVIMLNDGAGDSIPTSELKDSLPKTPFLCRLACCSPS